MKSAPVNVGNVNCKGKKTKLLSCTCCMAQNFKWDIRLKEADKEIKLYETKSVPLRHE